MWYPKRVPMIVSNMLPRMTWKLAGIRSKSIALSFDDGPHPESTPALLDLLDQCDIKATMFLIGQNVERYPELYQEILSRGHAVGAHGMTHVDGWCSGAGIDTKEAIESMDMLSTRLYRPPYGRLSPHAWTKLKDEYEIIMWSLISGDFDRKITEWDIDQILNRSRQGDIIVMHDTPYAYAKYKEVLAPFIVNNLSKGISFVTL